MPEIRMNSLKSLAMNCGPRARRRTVTERMEITYGPHTKGSIYLDRDGRWRASVHLGYRDGKRVRKLLSAATRTEVAGKLTAALRSKQLGVPMPSEKQTVAQYLRGWLQNVAKPNTRPKTFTSYEYLTREHLIPALGTKTLAKLGPQDVREFMKAKMDARLSAKTVKYLRDTLRCALNVAVRDGILVRNAAALVKPPRETQRALTVLTQDQARQLDRKSTRLNSSHLGISY